MDKKVGLIALGVDMDNELLLVDKGDGLYFPEIDVSKGKFKSNNIVESTQYFAETLNLDVKQISLAYVINRHINKSVYPTYYFIVLVDGCKNIPENFIWELDAYEKVNGEVYGEDFLNTIKNGLEKGFLMGNINIFDI